MSVYCVTSAGYYVRLERDQRNEHYGYKEYLDVLRAGVQEQSEELLAEENQSYSQTLNFALDMCVYQQASNHNLYRVCDYKDSLHSHFQVPLLLVHRSQYSNMCTIKGEKDITLCKSLILDSQ